VALLAFDGWLAAGGHWHCSGHQAVPKRLIARSAGKMAHAPLSQAGSIVAISVLFALVYHHAAAAGLLADGNQARQVQDAHVADFIPKMSRAAAYQAYCRKAAVFIDARLAVDYVDGHIDGAISVPVDADAARRSAILNSVPQSQSLIVYCQSKGCPYAMIVASRLIREGRGDVKVYADGWEGWHDNASH
jgi:rhodanese-related sulfurtransferase